MKWLDESEDKDWLLDKYVLEINAQDIKDRFSEITRTDFSRMFIWKNSILVGNLVQGNIKGKIYDVSTWEYQPCDFGLIHTDFIHPASERATNALRDLLSGASSRTEKAASNIYKQMQSSGLNMEGVTLVLDFESLYGLRGIEIKYKNQEIDQKRVSLFELLLDQW